LAPAGARSDPEQGAATQPDGSKLPRHRFALMSEEPSDAVEKLRYALQHHVDRAALVDGGAAGGGLRLH
ncbi:MAG TPA: hypothetical protein DIW86_16090, partial [Pseudomonas sp.]|nr:hypothetical protein [Pseudomonas sp.]